MSGRGEATVASAPYRVARHSTTRGLTMAYLAWYRTGDGNHAGASVSPTGFAGRDRAGRAARADQRARHDLRRHPACSGSTWRPPSRPRATRGGRGDGVDGSAALPRAGAAGRGGDGAGPGQLRGPHLDGGGGPRVRRGPADAQRRADHAGVRDLRRGRRGGRPAAGAAAGAGVRGGSRRSPRGGGSDAGLGCASGGLSRRGMDRRDDPRALLDAAALVEVGGPKSCAPPGPTGSTSCTGCSPGTWPGSPRAAGGRALLLTSRATSSATCGFRPRRRGAPGGGRRSGGAHGSGAGRYAIMDDFAAAPEPALRCWRCTDRGARAGGAAGVEVRPTCGAARSGPTRCGRRARPAVGGEAPRGTGARGSGSAWTGAAPRWLCGGRLAAVGVSRLRDERAEALRIETGEPGWGVEITEDYFPMEVGLSGAIDYGKGCFLGQEPIVRIRDRGHINWRLVRTAVRARARSAPGDRLESESSPGGADHERRAVARRAGGRRSALLHVSVPVGAEVRSPPRRGALAAEVVRSPSEGVSP